MKIFSTLTMATVGAVLLSTTVMAQPQPKGPPAHANGGMPHGKSFKHMFNYLDADADGRVSLDEAVDAHRSRAVQMFGHIDQNEDGEVTLEELQQGRQNHHERHGNIDKDAFKTCLEDELGEDLPERPTPEARFNAIDTDQSGSISEEEFLAHSLDEWQQRFDAADVDESGDLDEDEVKALHRQKQGRGRIMRECAQAQHHASGLLNPR